jgi:hypothetical protein
MDMATRVDYGFVLAALVLPALIVLLLRRRYYISVPIGTLLFWGWSVVTSSLLLEVDPEYDSIAPALFVLFGGLIGASYCCFWVVIREIISFRRKSKIVRQPTECASTKSATGAKLPFAKAALLHSIGGLVVWGALSILCICIPFLDRAIYNEANRKYILYYIFACVPTLLLCLAMSSIYLLEVLRKNRGGSKSVR